MVAEKLCREIAEGIGRGFSCQEVGPYVQVRTPFVYPDGHIIDLYMRSDDDRWMASDLGETHRWLDAHAWSEKRTPAQQELIHQICTTLGIQEARNALVIQVDEPADTAEAVTRLAQAASRVADIWFTFRAKLGESVRDQVEDFLVQKKIVFEREVRRAGKSGTTWKLDFETISPRQKSWVLVLSTGSRGAASQIRDHAVAAWVDLGAGQDNGSALVSLFDDTMDVWKDEDFRQLEAVSTVALWSNPEDFLSHLGRAA